MNRIAGMSKQDLVIRLYLSKKSSCLEAVPRSGYCWPPRHESVTISSLCMISRSGVMDDLCTNRSTGWAGSRESALGLGVLHV